MWLSFQKKGAKQNLLNQLANAAIPIKEQMTPSPQSVTHL
jgi:hypothetical protein